MEGEKWSTVCKCVERFIRRIRQKWVEDLICTMVFNNTCSLLKDIVTEEEAAENLLKELVEKFI